MGVQMARVITQPGLLMLLYPAVAHDMVMRAQQARGAILANMPIRSAQIELGLPIPFFDQSLDEAIEQAFSRFVTVALDPDKRHEATDRLSDEALWHRMYSALRVRLGPAAKFSDPNSMMVVQSPGGVHGVTIHIRLKQRLGVVRSAFYDPVTVKLHLMDSLLDLQCARRVAAAQDAALFVLRPARDSSEPSSLDAVLTSVAFRCDPGTRLVVEHDIQVLEQKLVDWVVA